MAFFKQWREHLGHETVLPKVGYLLTIEKFKIREGQQESKLYPEECLLRPFKKQPSVLQVSITSEMRDKEKG